MKTYKFYNYTGYLKHVHYKDSPTGKFFIGRFYLNNQTSKFVKGNQNQIIMLEALNLEKPVSIWGIYVKEGAFSIKRISEPLEKVLASFNKQKEEFREKKNTLKPLNFF